MAGPLFTALTEAWAWLWAVLGQSLQVPPFTGHQLWERHGAGNRPTQLDEGSPCPKVLGGTEAAWSGFLRQQEEMTGVITALEKSQGNADMRWENGLLGGKRKGHQISSATDGPRAP